MSLRAAVRARYTSQIEWQGPRLRPAKADASRLVFAIGLPSTPNTHTSLSISSTKWKQTLLDDYYGIMWMVDGRSATWPQRRINRTAAHCCGAFVRSTNEDGKMVKVGERISGYCQGILEGAFAVLQQRAHANSSGYADYPRQLYSCMIGPARCRTGRSIGGGSRGIPLEPSKTPLAGSKVCSLVSASGLRRRASMLSKLEEP
jgi:hypothetical protein